MSRDPRNVVVVGAGVAGLGAARAALVRGLDVLLIEAGPRAGGLVRSVRTEEGFLLEDGADSLLATKPAARRSAAELNLTLVRSPAGGKSYVRAGGRLHPLPQGFMRMDARGILGLMSSPLFSLRGKGRMAAEPFIPAREEPGDEAVASFFERRFGKELVDRLIDPMFGGIYGSPADRLSMGAVLPRLAELERAHGSVAKGLARSTAPPAPPKGSSAGGKPGSPLASLREGLGALPEAMARSLGERLRYEQELLEVKRRAGGGFSLRLRGGPAIEADALVIATPAWAAARFLEGLDPDLAVHLAELPYSSLHLIHLAWDREQIPHLFEGSGFVVARSERLPFSACSIMSQKWGDRAPEGKVLLRTVLRDGGGAGEALRGEEAEALTLAALRETLGVSVPPLFVRQHRRPRALPRYEVGHCSWVRRAHARAGQLGPIALAGNAFGGIGVPDSIASGEAALARLFPDDRG